MIKIKKATDSDYVKILPLLKHFTNPPPLEIIFKNPWQLADNYYGYILIDDEQVVGYAGTIFSRVPIDNQLRNFCNITTVVTEESHRDKAAYLLMSILKQDGCVFTNFTPSPSIREILLHLGFKKFNPKANLILPLPSLHHFSSRYEWVFAHEMIAQHLKGDNLKIFNDHLDCPNTCHGLLKTAEGSCYFLANRVDKKGLPFAKIHYVSNVDFFLDHIGKIAFRVCLKLYCVSMQVNQHILGTQRTIPWAISYNLRPKLFKADDLNEQQITTLYSEEVLLLSKNNIIG
ncbi:MAG: hypothetical protein HQL70_05360 [Magnetococcales bacterium]|nr:hypothetical protein [Magnetococcales bacterium]